MDEITRSDEARRLFLSESYGMLSTQSVEVEGYPFGSIVPYCQDVEGQPIILISRLAQHTKNITKDNKVSLLILDSQENDKQKAGRLTLLCVAEPVSPNDVAERYYRHYPDAEGYHSQLDFDFYRLSPVKVRYIGGFGKIHWLPVARFLLTNPFSYSCEKEMVDHMNQDHVKALKHYCVKHEVDLSVEAECIEVECVEVESVEASTVQQDGQQSGQLSQYVTPQMSGMDGEGFQLRVGDQLVRFWFPEKVRQPQQARAALVKMARN